MVRPHFATLWQGQLTGFEAACIASFVRRGYAITVYSYEPIGSLPDGVVAADAALIAPAGARTRFLIDGKPNLSHFSDYFRYKLFEQTNAIWVDADMLLVRGFDVDLPDMLLAREQQPSICGAVLRITKGEHLGRLVSRTEAAMGRDLVWGETGPNLLSLEFGRDVLLQGAYPAESFFAIDHDNFWKVFLPAYAEECEALTRNSWGVHLWNNVVDRLGVWKKLAPPKGSYLHRRWAEDGSLAFFKDEYPVKIMEQLIENWRFRQDGSALGIGAVARQLAPSVGRTLRHYVGPQHSVSSGILRLKTRLLHA